MRWLSPSSVATSIVSVRKLQATVQHADEKDLPGFSVQGMSCLVQLDLADGFSSMMQFTDQINQFVRIGAFFSVLRAGSTPCVNFTAFHLPTQNASRFPLESHAVVCNGQIRERILVAKFGRLHPL
jgi:hypothetical protein